MSCVTHESAAVEPEFLPAFQATVLHVSGSLDEVSAPLFREHLYSAIDRGCRDLILEMGQVRAINSVGLGAIVAGIRRFGEERGRIAVAECPPPVEAVLRMGGLTAVVTLYPSVQQACQELFPISSQSFEAARENSARLRSWIRSTVESLQLLPEEQDGIEAAASEAFTNAVEHAAAGKNCPVLVRVVLGSAVIVEVEDRGPGFEARQYLAVDPLVLNTGTRGLGIHVMRNLMDQVEFIAGASSTTDCPPGTTVRLVKRLRSPGKRRNP